MRLRINLQGKYQPEVVPSRSIYSHRGCRKKNSWSAETELLEVEDMVRAEEALEQDEEDGMTLEPFNLEQERQAGTFDESGNYVEHKEEEDPTMQDAWLTSDGPFQKLYIFMRAVCLSLQNTGGITSPEKLQVLGLLGRVRMMLY